jgi:hypothetical protein
MDYAENTKLLASRAGVTQAQANSVLKAQREQNIALALQSQPVPVPGVGQVTPRVLNLPGWGGATVRGTVRLESRLRSQMRKLAGHSSGVFNGTQRQQMCAG